MREVPPFTAEENGGESSWVAAYFPLKEKEMYELLSEWELGRSPHGWVENLTRSKLVTPG